MLTNDIALQLLDDATWMQRMAIAGKNVAGQVLGEAAATAGRDKRHTFAKQVADRPIQQVVNDQFWNGRIALILGANVGTTNLAVDSDHTAMVNAWIPSLNDLAGVKDGE